MKRTTVLRVKVLSAVKALVFGAAMMTSGAVLAVTPTSTGTPGGTPIVINNAAGDQTEPDVDGDLAVYTANASNLSSIIHYYRFSTGTDSTVPTGAPGELDMIASVTGNQIAFSRLHPDFGSGSSTSAMVFDIATGTVTQVAPEPPVPGRFGCKLGNHVLTFEDVLDFGPGDIFVIDLSTGGPLVNLSASTDDDNSPAISPAGDAVVWAGCAGRNCDILKAINTGGTWSAPLVVSATPATESDPDTDGTTVVYTSDRPSATDQDIYFQPLAGGAETQLEIPGLQRNPSVSGDVIAFEGTAVAGNAGDLFVYITTTGQLLQVTNTPTVNETLNALTVLPNGDVRVAWAADDDLTPGQHNIYAQTFTVDHGQGDGDGHGAHCPHGNPHHRHHGHHGRDCDDHGDGDDDDHDDQGARR
jgi:hypothetical protein